MLTEVRESRIGPTLIPAQIMELNSNGRAMSFVIVASAQPLTSHPHIIHISLYISPISFSILVAHHLRAHLSRLRPYSISPKVSSTVSSISYILHRRANPKITWLVKIPRRSETKVCSSTAPRLIHCTISWQFSFWTSHSVSSVHYISFDAPIPFSSRT